MRLISLIGFMGSGKTQTARYLGRVLGRRVISTDQEIERQEGRSIAIIFQEEGEAYFRKREEEMIQRLVGLSGIVLDCGGGVVLKARNVVLLKQAGPVVYLETSPEWIHRRTRHKRHRPLLNGPNPQEVIADLLAARETLYQQADYTVNTDNKTVETVGREILRILDKTPQRSRGTKS